ncbi:hypothetical protein HYW66_01150 [Candidatus Microgenomates bacterium]|nr:hypothetical protein [Candidatus Microgenomates bacterium]
MTYNHESGPGNTPEIVIPGEGFEVLRGALDTTGRFIGADLAASLLFSPHINRLVVLGPPAAGKSTLLDQLRKLLIITAQTRQIPLVIKTAAYEDVRERRQDFHTPEFNEELFREILHPVKSAIVYPGQQPKEIHLNEIPASGSADVGKTVVSRLAQGGDDAIFVRVIAHPVTQRKTISMREAVISLRPGDVIRTLKEQFHYEIAIPARSNSVATGIKIQKLFSKMADGEIIRRVQREVGNIAWQWQFGSAYPNYVGKIILPLDYLTSVMSQVLEEEFSFLGEAIGNHVQESIALGALGNEQNKRDEAAYGLYVFDNLGLPPERQMVVFNPYHRGTIHGYLVGE